MWASEIQMWIFRPFSWLFSRIENHRRNQVSALQVQESLHMKTPFFWMRVFPMFPGWETSSRCGALAMVVMRWSPTVRPWQMNQKFVDESKILDILVIYWIAWNEQTVFVCGELGLWKVPRVMHISELKAPQGQWFQVGQESEVLQNYTHNMWYLRIIPPPTRVESVVASRNPHTWIWRLVLGGTVETKWMVTRFVFWEHLHENHGFTSQKTYVWFPGNQINERHSPPKR